MIDERTFQALMARLAYLENRYSRTEVIEGGREILTADKYYYVATTGSDSTNTGLSAGSPFLTIQHAIDVASAALDLSIYSVAIFVAAGTYSIGATTITLRQFVGAGQVYIVGDVATPANVTVTNSASFTSVFTATHIGTIYNIWGIRIQSTAASDARGIESDNGSQVQFENCEFSTGLTRHLSANMGGVIIATGNYLISGGGNAHILADEAGIIRTAGRTATLSGTPNFALGFAYVYKAQAIAWGMTFAGTGATGQEYQVAANGVIDVAGAGAGYFPGSLGGSTATGGQYV